MTLSWASIASILIGGVPGYRLCPWLGGGQCLRTQTKGWGRLRWNRRAALGGCGGGALGGAGQPVTDKEASGKSGPQETTTKSPSLNLGLVGVQPQLYTTAEWMAKEEPPGEVEN